MDYHNAFINILELLIPYGWQFIKTDVNEIIMNKKFHELEEITIQSTNQSTINLLINPLLILLFLLKTLYIAFIKNLVIQLVRMRMRMRMRMNLSCF